MMKPVDASSKAAASKMNNSQMQLMTRFNRSIHSDDQECATDIYEINIVNIQFTT